MNDLSRMYSILICQIRLEDTEHVLSGLQAVLCGESTRGSVSAVESVLQVDASLSDQVVPSHQVIVVDQDR